MAEGLFGTWWETTLVVTSIIFSLMILSIIIRRYQIRKTMYKQNTRIDGKVVIITGANSGIGKETALDLAKRGGKIYMACRNIKTGKEALEEIKSRSGNNEIYLMHLDLTSFDSINVFVNRFKKTEQHLHILINNAGVLAPAKRVTEDGFEATFGVNHLGHFLLTLLLVDTMHFSEPSRIIIVASNLHSIVNLHRDKLNSEFSTNTLTYAHSKLLNLLFAKELAKKLKHTKITVNSLHPGAVDTDIARNFSPCIKKIFKLFSRAYFKSAKEGAQTQIMLAVDPRVENISGMYFAGCMGKRPSSAARNNENAEWLWDKSLELLGIPDFSVVEYLNRRMSGYCLKIERNEH